MSNKGFTAFCLALAVGLAAVPVLDVAAAQPRPAGKQQSGTVKPGKAPQAPEPAASASAPPPDANIPVFEKQLLRLSEILGSLHFLRALCKGGDAPVWRDQMQALLNAENPSDAERAKYVARFNHGFDTFAAVYRSCTPAAQRSIALYLTEGHKLAAEIRTRYSQ